MYSYTIIDHLKFSEKQRKIMESTTQSSNVKKLELIAEAKAEFSYYGNAVHKQQSGRIDDAIMCFDEVMDKIFAFLAK